MRVWRTRLVYGLSVVIALLATGELFAKYVLGLGTPPLSITHPTIEYLLKPNQDLYRFGNHVITNEYGMRSMPFALQKQANELRIMVFGDSVVNGGSLTSHENLATSRLQNHLSAVTDKKVIVGNISAGSWGPANWLAYAKSYGFFDADIVVLVISSHDYVDIPTFESLNESTHPTHKPASALWEGFSKYLIRYIDAFFVKNAAVPAATTEVDRENPSNLSKLAEKSAKGLRDLERFLKLAQHQSKYVLVVQHWEESEIADEEAWRGNQLIAEVSNRLEIETVSLRSCFENAMNSGKVPYRDSIHPSVVGQALMAQTLSREITQELNFISP